eukprot:gnl/TRDRNA2_/TRDRNA2_165622_c0_seq1.p1 gnl/TRDRNA2_/TRDRNA2_165622_c0~~gnl/TRDRNA2_/TRDRNA2_165622_c0_seq1.p1  ORF type:complete len:297 (+),score=42.83 gnl/TRDRNA2_/TRDRNA2_165622_c0_seq1:73-891(+)
MPGVCVVVGASSKWQADGSSTVKTHGGRQDDGAFSDDVKWGVGGAVSLRFARGGYTVVLFSRKEANVAALADAIHKQGGVAICVVCELSSDASVAKAFEEVRAKAGDPSVLIYNAGYTSHGGSEVLIEDLKIGLLDDAHHTQCRGAVLCCQQVLPAMRKLGEGTILFSSVPQAMRASAKGLPNSITKAGMRALCQAISEEYQKLGVHACHLVLNGLIDSPGTHKFTMGKPEGFAMDPAAIAEVYWQVHTQHKSTWTSEMVLTPWQSKIAGRL